MLRWTGGLRRLEEAAVARFGNAGKRVSGYPPTPPDPPPGAYKVDVQGGTATAAVPGAPAPTRLIRVNGQWKVDYASTMGAADPELRAALGKMDAGGKVAYEVADEIAAGRYQTAEQAKAAFQRRRQQAVRGE
jgi:hypothetical protein